MFEDLENNPVITARKIDSGDDVKFIKETLGTLAPDFVEFIEKFGAADIGDGFFYMYSAIEDLDAHLAHMGLDPLGLNAWAFGDGDSDIGIIDKTTGEVSQLCHESYEIYAGPYKTFSEFLYTWLLRE